MSDFDLEKYGDHKPTQHDTHLKIREDDGGREDWLIVPVGRTRHTDDPVTQSNWESALKLLGGEGEDVEVHRFGHWGPGWYEMILVRPGSPSEKVAKEIASALDGYCILDDEDHSRREHEREMEDWDNGGSLEFKELIIKEFGLEGNLPLDDWELDELDEATKGQLYDIYYKAGGQTEHWTEGTHFSRRFDKEDLQRALTEVLGWEWADE